MQRRKELKHSFNSSALVSTGTFLCSPVSRIPHFRHFQVSKSISASRLPMRGGTTGTIKMYGKEGERQRGEGKVGEEVMKGWK